MSSKRTRQEIACEILTFLQEEGPQKQTVILGKCNLSWAMVKVYLARLEMQGLIGSDGEGYSITKTGRKYLRSLVVVLNV